MKIYKNITLASGIRIDTLSVNAKGKGLVRTSQRGQPRAKADAAERYLRMEGFLEKESPEGI